MDDETFFSNTISFDCACKDYNVIKLRRGILQTSLWHNLIDICLMSRDVNFTAIANLVSFLKYFNIYTMMDQNISCSNVEHLAIPRSSQ